VRDHDGAFHIRTGTFGNPPPPLWMAIAALCLAAACPVSRTLAAASDSTRAASATQIVATERFEFHSDAWINLHHFLYHWAREDRGLGTDRQYVTVPERASLAAVPDPERAQWLGALAVYRDSVAARGHFDSRMLQLKQALVRLGGDPLAAPPDLIAGVGGALAAAMPVYRSRWWARHDEANRAWAAAVVPLLTRHEERFVELTRRVYAAEWPSTPFRVDVSAYANARAGYTEPAAGHIVIYSTDAGNQGLYGLETLVHEVQHARSVGSRARREFKKAFDSARVPEPENLWHGVIFSTAGEFVGSVARQEKLPEHQPYWIREGFDRLQGWRAIVPATGEDWLPVVRATASREQGFTALARRFGKP
jgi:hypothetical protein